MQLALDCQRSRSSTWSRNTKFEQHPVVRNSYNSIEQTLDSDFFWAKSLIWVMLKLTHQVNIKLAPMISTTDLQMIDQTR